MKTSIKCLLIISALAMLSACATSGPRYEKADEGLRETLSGNFDIVLLKPDRQLPAFSRVYIENPEVTMNRQWLTSFRSDYSRSDLERIDRDYSRLLKKSLAKGLNEQSGITVVDNAAEAELILQPRLLNLNIYAPDLMTSGRRSYYGREVGNATLDMRLINPANNEVVGQFVDHRETNRGQFMQGERANRITNARYFGRMFDRWTHNFVDYLIDINALEHAE